jgi:hypothetical protein
MGKAVKVGKAARMEKAVRMAKAARMAKAEREGKAARADRAGSGGGVLRRCCPQPPALNRPSGAAGCCSCG